MKCNKKLSGREQNSGCFVQALTAVAFRKISCLDLLGAEQSNQGCDELPSRSPWKCLDREKDDSGVKDNPLSSLFYI